MAMLKEQRRFWDKVDIKNPDQCWQWMAFCDRYGYGRFMLDGKAVSAHRLSACWAGILVDMNSQLHVCHSCDNTSCVNPQHLFVGTHQDNMADRDNKGRHICVSQPGSQHGMSKLDEDDVRQIRMLRQQGLTQRVIANQFGVTRSMISYIVNNKNWQHV